MTKARGIGRGGRRSGAGRKPGSRNKRSEFLIRRAEADDLELPVPRLLRRINDKTLPENYRDSLAAIAAPYFHSRLSSTTAKVQILDLADMTDQQLHEWNERAEAYLEHLEQMELTGVKPQGRA